MVLEDITEDPEKYNYLCTYDFYSSVHNVLDACISITRGSEWGLGPEILKFFGPVKWHREYLHRLFYAHEPPGDFNGMYPREV